MVGDTHKKGGMLCSVVGFALLKHNGLLLDDVNQVLQLAVIYPFCMWGSVASDLDHHWKSCPSKDIPSWFVNKALHITTPVYKKLDEKLSGSEKKQSTLYKVTKTFSASHRSWQTHSDLTIVVMMLLLWSVMTGKFNSVLGATDVSILSLILTGICMGIIAHFILDMLTPEKVWCLLGVFLNKILGLLRRKRTHLFPEKIGFVPKMKCFATGSGWEDFINGLVKVLTVVSVLYVLLDVAFPNVIKGIIDAIPYQISFN